MNIVDSDAVMRLKELREILLRMVSECECRCNSDVREVLDTEAYLPLFGKDIEVNGDGSIIEVVFNGKYLFNLMDFVDVPNNTIEVIVNEICFYMDGETDEGLPNYVPVYVGSTPFTMADSLVVNK